MNDRPVFRFAPSPTGTLHLGSAYSALVSHDMAREAGARFLLRIEDIDAERCRPEFEQAILEDLAWLGLEWEQPVRRQSEQLDVYGGYAATLESQGLLYPCFASRKEIAEAVAAGGPHLLDPDGAPVYPGLCKGLPKDEAEARIAQGEPVAWRIDMDKALELARKRDPGALTFTEVDREEKARVIPIDPARWGDAVIVRKFSTTSYHLSVVVDDALQGVSRITRGMDLFAATDLHRLLQILLELPEPHYSHHALVLDGEGRKLSKSEGDTSIARLREKGHTPADVRAMAERNLIAGTVNS